MQNNSKLFKRLMASVLSVAMFLAVLCPAIPVFAADEDSELEISAAEIIANNYPLTEAEKNILNSGYLAGDVYTISVPDSDDGLVSVDTDNKTVTAENYTKGGYTWTPTKADITVNGAVKETVALTDGTGAYTYDGNAFAVVVSYEVKVSISQAVQLALISAPADIKQGIADLDAMYEAEASLATLVTALDVLEQLANGISVQFGTMTVSLKMGAEAAAVTKALVAEKNANGGSLNVSVMLKEYKDAASQTEYLLTNAAQIKTIISDTYEKIATIAADDVFNNNMVDAYFEGMAPADYVKWKAFKNNINNWLSVAGPIAEATWSFESNNPVAQYTGLDLLIAALTSTTDVSTLAISEELVAGTTDITYSMNMYNVYVTVSLKMADGVVNSSNLVTHSHVGKVTLTLVEGATEGEIKEALDASGVLDDSVQAWGSSYVDGQFTINLDTLTDDEGFTLGSDMDWNIDVVANGYTVELGYNGESATYPYGALIQLEKNSDASIVYDYYVNGTYVAQGSIIKVEEDLSITRKEGKPYVTSNLAQIVSGCYLDPASTSAAILESDALLVGDEYISVRYPDNTEGTLVTFKDGVLKAASYDASYEGLVWVPYSYKAEGGDTESGLFNGANEITLSGDFDFATVNYRLALTNIPDADVLEVLNIAGILLDEANAQTEALAKLLGKINYLEELDRTKLGALNGVIDVTPLHEDEAKNAELVAYFKSVVSDIINKGCNSDGKLYIYVLLSVYADANNGGLGYYYENYAAFKDQINILTESLSKMMADDEKKAALNVLVSAAGYPELSDTLADLESIMSYVNNSLTAPNEAIDLDSENVDKLIALLSSGASADSYNALPYGLYLAEDIVVAADNKITVSVVLQTAAGKYVTIAPTVYNSDYVITPEDAAALIEKIEQGIASLGIDTQYYSTDYNVDIIKEIAGIEAGELETVAFTFTWTPNEYTVVIDGVEDQKVSVDSLTVTLPAHSDAAYRYDYIVDGVTVSSGKYTFTTAQLIDLFANGKYEIVRKEVYVARENLINMVNGLNESVKDEAIKFALTENNGQFAIILQIDASKTSSVMDSAMGAAMGFVDSGYAYIAIDNNAVIGMNEENTLEISVQAVVDAIMNSGFGSDTIIAAMDANGNINNMDLPGEVISANGLDKAGAELITTTMQLGGNASDAMNVDFYITLGASQDTLTQVRNLLANQLKAYFSFECVGGEAVMYIDMPQKAYEAYLAVLLVTGNLDITDVNAINAQIAIGFMKDLVDPMLAEGVEAQTFANTLNKFGYELDLSGYESAFDAITSFYNKNTANIVYDETSGTVQANLPISQLIDKLDLGDIGKMISEYDTGIDVTAKLVIENINDEYEAIFFDVDASGITNKFGAVSDIAAKLDDMAGATFIILLKDIESELHFKTGTILNLNGFTVSKGITGDATLYIVDSALTEDAGKVEGPVSGDNVVILGGTYSNDVSAYLKKGYTQDENGRVVHDLYTLNKDENGDIVLGINASILTLDYMPSIKAAAADLAVELLFNGYTANMLNIDGKQVYNFTFEDLVGAVTGTNRVNRLLEQFAKTVDCSQLADLLETIIEDVTDFDVVQAAINNDEPILSYEMITGSWTVEFDHVEDQNYLSANLTSGDPQTRNLKVYITGSDEDKQLLADLFGILNDTTDVRVDLDADQKLETGDDKIFTVNASGSASIISDFTDPKFAIMFSVIIADGIGAPANEALVAAIKDYYETGYPEALEEAFYALTTEQAITALKNLGKNDSFADMIEALGLTDVVDEEVVRLESMFDLVGKAAAAIVRRTDITGGSATLGSYVDSEGYFTFNRSASRDGILSYNNYSLVLNAESVEVLIRVKLFGEFEKEIDYSKLLYWIGESEKLNEADWTAESWANLIAALNSGKDALNSLDQDFVDNAADTLEAAYKALVPVPVIELDYSELEANIAEAEALNEADWTAESWAVLADALAAGKAGLYNCETQEQIDALADAIRAGIDQLVPVPVIDYSVLLAYIAEAEGLNEADWTAESWQTMLEALAMGKTALTYTVQADVDAAAANLRYAIDNLVPVVDNPETGDFADVAVWVSAALATAAVAVAIVIFKKRRTVR